MDQTFHSLIELLHLLGEYLLFLLMRLLFLSPTAPQTPILTPTLHKPAYPSRLCFLFTSSSSSSSSPFTTTSALPLLSSVVEYRNRLQQCQDSKQNYHTVHPSRCLYWYFDAHLPHHCCSHVFKLPVLLL